MDGAKKIEKLMKVKNISRYKLSKETGIPYSTLTQIINFRTKNPQIKALEKLADYFEVPLDYLIGKSARSIIEDTLEEKGMALSDLAEKASVPLAFLQNLDSIVPDQEIDGGEQCYVYMSSIAWVLGIPGSKLRTALARQEIPASEYPDAEPLSAEEEFADADFDNTHTLAAHHDGEDWTEEELSDIEKFKEFLRTRRSSKN